MKLRWVVVYGLGALFIGVVLLVLTTSFSRRVKVINIADYDRSSRELRLASAMPTCGCLTITRKFNPTLGDRVRRGIDWVRRLGSRATDHKPFELRVRMNGRGEEIGRLPLDVPTEEDATEALAKSTEDAAKKKSYVEAANKTLTFAFDWAGERIGDFYEIKVYDSENEPIDFGARFDMTAEPGQPCDGTVCPFKLPGLDRGLTAAVGQDDVRSAFAGATTARGDRAIEVVASPPAPVTPGGEPLGGCGCLLLQVREDVTLRATLQETSRGYLTLQKGHIETIAFDYGSTSGDRYVITAVDDSRPISDFVNVIGHLDKMGCQQNSAIFEPDTLMSVAPTVAEGTATTASKSNAPTGNAQQSNSPQANSRTAEPQGEGTAALDDHQARLLAALRGLNCSYHHPGGNMRLLAMVPSAAAPDMPSEVETKTSREP